MFAASTTRPVRGGKAGCGWANADAGTRSAMPSPRMSRIAGASRGGTGARPARIGRSRPPAAWSELHRRRPVGPRARGKRLHRLRVRIEDRRDPAPRDGAQLGVVLAHRADVVAARDRDAVLGALELRLQGEEIGVRLQLGIALDGDEEAAESARELVLRLLEFPEFLRVGDGRGVTWTWVALARASITC